MRSKRSTAEQGQMPVLADRVTAWNIPAGSRRWPLIIAHRGDVAAAPENTMSAFRRALAGGADGIELDVHLTRDNNLLVFHDRTLTRTSDGYGLVDHYTLKELQTLDVGSWYAPAFKGEHPPELDEVFETVPPDYLLDIELKVVVKGMDLIAHKVAETIIRHRRWASTLVASSNPMALYHLRKFEPRIPRGYIWSKHHPYPIRARWLSPLAQADWWAPAHNTYGLQRHRHFQRRRRRVLAWDTDFGGGLEQMASAHLDAVVSDQPAALVQRKRELSRQLA